MTTEKPDEKEGTKPSSPDGNAVSVGTNTPGVKSTFKGRWKLILVLTIGVILLLILASKYYQNRDVYIVVGGRKVTKSQFNEAKTAHENYIKAVGGIEEGSKEDPDLVKKQLVLTAALENEADQNNISVTQEEIDAALTQYTSNLEGVGSDTNLSSADQVRDLQAKTYGWSTAYSNTRLRTALLQNKLREKLLNQVNVLQASLLLAPDTSLDENSGKAFLKDKISPIMSAHEGDYVAIAGALKDTNKNINVEFLPDVLNTALYPDLSEAVREVIRKLHTPRQVSEVVQTENNVLQMFRLESATKGEYGSWNDFTDKQFKKAEFINSWLDWRRLTL
jgi:hypothetical protein